MHEEYGDLDADHVFVNLWEGRIGHPLSYPTVDKLVACTRARWGLTSLRISCDTATLRSRIAAECRGR